MRRVVQTADSGAPEVAEARPLEGKVALVTGGAKRVGRAIALKLAQAGMDVAITYRSSAADAAEAVRAVEALGRRALAIRVDHAKPGSDALVKRRFLAEFSRLDALVNNASGFAPTPFAKLTPAQLRRAFDENMAVNALGPLMLIHQFAPLLAANHRKDDPKSTGRIVNFVDIHVLGQPLRGYVAYNASKAALLQITMTLAMELAPKITVNALAPGVVAWAADYTPAQREAYLKRVPLGRAGTPQDAAAAALFLVRDADYCTGQVIQLDGGRLWT
ncbi:MAG: SDR family oxidoreductase [Planctomycetota bacterium]|nr:SDR family oxidoreductase [Planctomycetota bacterium]